MAEGENKEYRKKVLRVFSGDKGHSLIEDASSFRRGGARETIVLNAYTYDIVILIAGLPLESFNENGTSDIP